MFVASVVAGSLPVLINPSEQYLKLMNIVGAGLMVGTALAVIIPEGAEAFYNAYPHGAEAPDGAVGSALVGGFLLMLVLDSVNFGGKRGGDAGKGSCCLDGSMDAEPHNSHKGSTLPTYDSNDKPLDNHRRKGGHIWQQPGFTTLIGILVHSGADGIAMGASAMSENLSTSVLVFAAIMMHKGPMAFGLATYLLNAGWSHGHLRQAMIMFSAAAPVVAVGGYMLLGNIPMFSSPASIAVCLLLSGGTFLYAACIHVLPEALDRSHHQPLTTTQVMAIFIGALIPLICSLALDHDHAHGHGHGHDEHVHQGHDELHHDEDRRLYHHHHHHHHHHHM
eukprot:CAMPEP_0197843610 /NCGR_PEP_ID=MMETSP1438-20131217/511_1 /TAXON_ID=1461541 /ORGANISM="Pterosperma sp., Strain CCMP1384" /LENGTH=334 /DNA_ID=CAMNT_0043453871 /DNA_START=346 /DNA_END=1350 /DNA_ORIENTATION=+